MADVPWQVVRIVGTVLLLGPPVAFYVYRDRKRRDESRPLAWALGLGVLGIAGLFLYLHLRGDFTGPERGDTD
ncbi:hypothetical protein [Halorussus caseinilyticus]|uniref:Cardiolipin synthase N-terminal domain-containing protein n=1 Tax=Halorussus caseinilyticus TaxID=3034025 RepID=A0ABD5WF91_9EURY|nr:hypothetical protein [Halorussus sp. DT72]